MKGREQDNHQPALQALIQRHATTPGKPAALRERSSKADDRRTQKNPNIISRIL